MKNQAGFTLIELIMVIVILGILAATAMPKFADIKVDARLAALEGLKGAMDSTAAIAHGTQQAKGYASNVDVVLGGTSVSMVNGYPTAGASGIVAALDLSGGKYMWYGTTAVSGIGFVSDNVSGVAPTCYISYTEATTAGVAPQASAVTTLC